MSQLIPFPEQRRNPVWDALVEIFGEPTTESNRALRGKIVRSLKGAGAIYEDVIARARAWPLHFPGATLTETALEKHWDRLGRPPLRASEADIDAYQAEMRSFQRQRRAQELEAEKRGLPE